MARDGGPGMIEEEGLRARGVSLVAGLDEAGRGPLAGPVVAAAVILPPGLDAPWLAQVRDSKELTAARREALFEAIREQATASVGIVSVEDIDRLNILEATREAMRLAVADLPLTPQFLLIDALHLPSVRIPQRGIVHGDRLCRSIAAASIVAKVTRDRLMAKLEARYPGYGFARHKGYGTAEHLEALRRLGPCPAHRRSFAPVRDACAGVERAVSTAREKRVGAGLKPARLPQQSPGTEDGS